MNVNEPLRVKKSGLFFERCFYLIIILILGYNASLYILESNSERHLSNFLKSNTHALSGLRDVRDALEKYYQKNGEYPKSYSFDGAVSCWGKSTPDWIPGLVPVYIKALPVIDPENVGCDNQYLYSSDTKGYKLLIHTPPDCEEIKIIFPELIDPQRDCWAYGFWSGGGKTF